MAAKPKQKLADQVIEEITQMIRDGRLREGDKLPNQTEFARQLGVSRLSLREALQTLQAMGVVTQKPKTGTIITCGSAQQLARPLPQADIGDVNAIFELLEARRVIEGAIARHAAEYANEKDVRHLEKLLQQSEKAFASGNVKAYTALDVKFHLYLMSIPGNRYLINMYLTVYNRVLQYMNGIFRARPDMWSAALAYHREILNALAAGDIGGTVKAVEEEHLSDIRKLKTFYGDSRHAKTRPHRDVATPLHNTG